MFNIHGMYCCVEGGRKKKKNKRKLFQNFLSRYKLYKKRIRLYSSAYLKLLMLISYDKLHTTTYNILFTLNARIRLTADVTRPTFLWR